MEPLACHRLLYHGALTRRPSDATLERTLTALAETLDLHVFAGPIVAHPKITQLKAGSETKETEEVEDTSRTSALVLIAESHIAIDLHRRAAWCQLSSCRPLDEGAIHATLSEHLPGAWKLRRQDSQEHE